MKQEKNPLKFWKSLAIVALCLLLAVSCLYTLGVGWNQTEKTPSDNGGPLSLWTKDAKLKQQLVAYVEAVTDEGGADFIPAERRIAVFDFNGALFCETNPDCFDYMLLVHRVLEDPDYKNKATDFERETAMKIVQQNETCASFTGLEVDHDKCIASSFSGLTPEKFNACSQEF